MNEQLKRKFPNWCFGNKKFSTVLTDDIDSLVGCAIEQKVNDNDIYYFYDFDSVYKSDTEVRFDTLGIDLAFTKGKCWDNHVTRLNKDSKVNLQSANINSLLDISGDNYFDKYAGSTALLMWSFYDLPLPDTKLGKMLLLAIDSGFLGHYDGRFKKIHNHYLESLGFNELIDLLNQTSKQEYFDLIKEYKLNAKSGGKIFIDDKGYLQTSLPLKELSDPLGLHLDLPKQPFILKNRFESIGRQVKGDEGGQLNKSIISFALTNKKYYKFTRRVS